MSTIYVVLFPIQEPEITAYCLNSDRCGHGIIGAIDLGFAAGAPCRRAECLYLEAQIDEPYGEIDGEPVIIRKLRPAPAASASTSGPGHAPIRPDGGADEPPEEG